MQWVAQTAQTALNTANEAKQTAESKAPIQHTHNKSEVWLDQVDNTSDEDKPLSKATKKALELKCSFADIVDNLNTEEIKPLSAKQGKVLKGLIDNINRILVSDDTDLDQLQEIVNYIKQNKKILSQLGISNISGLVEALNGKANKVHTHTKSQISDFPTSMPASDVHKLAISQSIEVDTIEHENMIHLKILETTISRSDQKEVERSSSESSLHTQELILIIVLLLRILILWSKSRGLQILDLQLST